MRSYNSFYAVSVAENITSGNEQYNSVPWFWADQYDIKLQIAGISDNHDEVIIRGKKSEKSFSCHYLKNGILIAVDAINRPRDFIHSKNLIYQKTIIDDDKNNIKGIDLKNRTLSKSKDNTIPIVVKIAITEQNNNT